MGNVLIQSNENESKLCNNTILGECSYQYSVYNLQPKISFCAFKCLVSKHVLIQEVNTVKLKNFLHLCNKVSFVLISSCFESQKGPWKREVIKFVQIVFYLNRVFEKIKGM